jgi:hypothetical protein
MREGLSRRRAQGGAHILGEERSSGRSGAGLVCEVLGEFVDSADIPIEKQEEACNIFTGGKVGILKSSDTWKVCSGESSDPLIGEESGEGGRAVICLGDCVCGVTGEREGEEVDGLDIACEASRKLGCGGGTA